MNDIYVWLILLAIVYILPEILGKSRKKKGKNKYEYPQFPDTPPVPTEKRKPANKQSHKPAENYPGFGYEYYTSPAKILQQEEFRLALSKEPPAPASVPPPVNVVPTVTSSTSPWQSALAPQVLANAVVFSEIILPPRAHRPFGRYYTGKTRR